MNYAEESLRLHNEWKGKIEVVATVPVASKDDLSLAYTPGVAQPCLEIQKNPEKSYDLTRRHNLCAVITDPQFWVWATSARKPVCRLWKVSAFCLRPSAVWMRSLFALRPRM